MPPATSATLETDRSRGDGVIVVALVGEHDLSTAPAVDSAVIEANRPRPGRLVVDLSRATFIDSCILRSLIAAKARSHVFAVAAPPGGEPRRLLDLVGVDRVLTVCDTLDAAARAV